MSRAGRFKPDPHVCIYPGLCFRPGLTPFLKVPHINFFFFSHSIFCESRWKKRSSAFHKRANRGRQREVTHLGPQKESVTKLGNGAVFSDFETTALTTGSHLLLKSKLSALAQNMAFVLDRCHWDWAVGFPTLCLPILIH